MKIADSSVIQCSKLLASGIAVLH